MTTKLTPSKATGKTLRKLPASAQNKRADQDNTLASISAIARMTGQHGAKPLHRQTVTQRLAAANIKPVKEKAKEKLYNVAEALAVLNEPDMDSSGLNEAKRKKMTVSAAREMLKLQRERGDLISKQEVADFMYAFIKAMRTRFKRYSRENARRLRKLRTESELRQNLETDFDLIFEDLKRDFPDIFGSQEKLR